MARLKTLSITKTMSCYREKANMILGGEMLAYDWKKKKAKAPTTVKKLTKEKFEEKRKKGHFEKPSC